MNSKIPSNGSDSKKTVQTAAKTIRAVPDIVPGDDAPPVAWAVWLARVHQAKLVPCHHPVKTAATKAAAVCSCKEGAACHHVGKHPRLTDWNERASSDPQQLRKWAVQFPGCNFGVATKATGWVVVDADGDVGRKSLQDRTAFYGDLPRTYVQSTGGGAHFCFRKPGDMPPIIGSISLAPGLDIRADNATNGGLIVAAGSVHWSGKRYSSRDATPVADMPQWLRAWLKTNDTASQPPPASAVVPTTVPPSAVPLAQRVARAQQYLAKADPSVSGQGGHSNAMRVVTAVVRGFQLEAPTAREALAAWNARCSPPWSPEELNHKISDAFAKGNMAWGKLLTEASAPGASASRFELFSVDDLEKKTSAPVPYIVAAFGLAPGRPAVIGGVRETCKSILGIELLLAVASGEATCWGNVDVQRQGAVALLDYEMGDTTPRRCVRLARGMGGVDFADLIRRGLFRLAVSPKLLLSADREVVRAALVELCTDVVLLVVDNFRTALGGTVDMNDDRVRTYLDLLREVSEQCGTTVVVLMHENTPGKIRGSTAIAEGTSVILSLSKRANTVTVERVRQTNGPKDTRTTTVQLLDEGAVIDVTTGELAALRLAAATNATASAPGGGTAAPGGAAVDRAKAAVLAFVASAPTPPGLNDVVKAVSGGRPTLQAAIDALRAEGLLLPKPPGLKLGQKDPLRLQASQVGGGDA